MKLVQFVYKVNPQDVHVGYMEGNNVVDDTKYHPTLPNTLLGMLRKGCICQIINSLLDSSPATEPIGSVTLVAPITGMDKIICVGLNYGDHCAEINKPLPTVPIIFSKFASCIIGQNEPVRLRPVVEKPDWEVELVAVMGKKCSNVVAQDALKYVFGYTIAQDITCRYWQGNNGGQWVLGKAQDSFCPLGPWIVTTDEIGDINNLDINCCINGELKQNSNTSQLIFKIPELIERLSSVMTLLPGDIILTGTPGGIGSSRSPPQYLKAGDVIHSEIQNIGCFDVTVENF